MVMSRPASDVPTRGTVDAPALEPGFATRAGDPARAVLGALRVVLGFYFLWAFVDKLFGFGFATAPEKAWINGGSPTTGYLKGVEGPFAAAFHTIAGAAWADWLFMAGLLGIGVALILGIAMRVATVAAVLMLALMYLASFPLETNPIIDDHVVDALAIAALGLLGAGDVFGLGTWWKAQPFVRRHPWLV
jgi:thiosulfate dehydrogenase [quinone] large subunit